LFSQLDGRRGLKQQETAERGCVIAAVLIMDRNGYFGMKIQAKRPKNPIKRMPTDMGLGD
jgi:hypothetical protein